MACTQCGSQIPAGAKFCNECGAAQRSTCPSCGAAVVAGAKFCNECGHALDATAPTQPAPAAPGSPIPAQPLERRVCSVLFCDLVGFTPMSEARDPEEVRELLSRYFAVAQEVIGRYGGTVEKFIGDAVMAVWGTPTATEGDVERAVRAGLDLVDGVRELGRVVGVESLQARAGVVTGEVAVTIGATGQGMVAGDAVNTAARVQSAAEPGSVLVDEGTWRLARGGIEFLSSGDYELKGKSNPVRLWRAQRVVSGVGGSQRVDGLEAPLVGRDTELRLIKEMFHACADRQSPRLVSVTGPAGVGKSRLGWEFEKYADGVATSVWWHRGRCLSYGDGVAFWALAEMIRQRFGIAEDDPTAVAAQKLASQLPSFVLEPAEQDYVMPRLASLLGIDPSATALPTDELFAGWRLFFERLASTGPVVMLVEDLQYADTGLLDFLDHLLEWARDVPVFVLTLARPEIEERRPGWGAGRRNTTALALDPLDDDAMAAMLDGLVPGMSVAARDSVARQAQGMPLYAVETIRMLVDREVVQPIDGAYRLVGDVGELSVPDTLQQLLAARLDALPATARRVVADAAVLGGTFSPEALAAVSATDVDEVREALTALVRREVLEVKADPLSPDRGQYGFVQTMFRQVAYDTLSRRERKARHLAVVNHLSRISGDGGDEVSEVIATHLLDALDAVPDDPDVAEIRERAVSTLERAGERAERTGAPATALRVFTKAAELCEHTGMGGDVTGRLLESAGENASRMGDRVAAVELLKRAGAVFRQAGEKRKAALAESRAGRPLVGLGNVSEARELLQHACAALEDPVGEDTAIAVGALAWLELANGTPEGDALIARALDLAQGLGMSPAHIANLLVTCGVGHAQGGRMAQAHAHYREALRMADAVGDSTIAARALMNIADLLMFVNPTEAAAYGRDAVTQCRRTGNRLYLGTAVGNLLTAMHFLDDWATADQLVRDGIEQDGLASDSSFSVPATIFLVLRGEPIPGELAETNKAMLDSEDLQERTIGRLVAAYLAKAEADVEARYAEAVRALDAGEELDVAHEVNVQAWPLAADVALELGNIDRVDELLQWLDRQPAGHIPPALSVERKRIVAKLAAARGDADAAGFMADAIATMRQFGSPYHLSVALLDAADVVAAAHPEQARQHADEAREIAQRLGAGSLAGRLDRHGLTLVAAS